MKIRPLFQTTSIAAAAGIGRTVRIQSILTSIIRIESAAVCIDTRNRRIAHRASAARSGRRFGRLSAEPAVRQFEINSARDRYGDPSSATAAAATAAAAAARICLRRRLRSYRSASARVCSRIARDTSRVAAAVVAAIAALTRISEKSVKKTAAARISSVIGVASITTSIAHNPTSSCVFEEKPHIVLYAALRSYVIFLSPRIPLSSFPALRCRFPPPRCEIPPANGGVKLFLSIFRTYCKAREGRIL